MEQGQQRVHAKIVRLETRLLDAQARLSAGHTKYAKKSLMLIRILGQARENVMRHGRANA